jgi:cyanophycin synthetase
MAAAAARGVHTEILDGSVDRVRYRRGARSVDVVAGTWFSCLTARTAALLDDKRATKALFRRLDVATLADAEDATGWDEWLASGPVVVKPRTGTGGEGVSLNLTSPRAVREAVEALDDAIVEPFHDGADLRIHALGGRVLAACRRDPAFVVGDGKRTLRSLVQTLEAHTQHHNPANRVLVDPEVLGPQGVTLGDVPAAGVRVSLNRLCNMALGAIATDVTEALHPEFSAWVERLTDALELPVFGLDVLTDDPGTDPTAGRAAALEINARPDWLHHTFSEGRTHDVATALLSHFLE